MKKTLRSILILLSIVVGTSIDLHAQVLKFEEAKQMLTDYRWSIRRLEQNGKMFSVPEDMRGLVRVFLTNGMTYSFVPSEKESEAEQHKYSVTKTQMTFFIDDDQMTFTYRVEDFIGYKLYLDVVNNGEILTFVFDRAEKNVVKPVSQTVTTAQAKTMLTDYKWTIRALEKEGKLQPVPKQVQGLKRVFLKDGLTYSFLPSETEEDAVPYEWTIDAGRINFYKPNKTETYEYKLVNNNGYVLYLDMMGNDSMPTFVFERAEKNEGIIMLERVLIGDQLWTDRNINIDTFRNGDPIVESKSAAQWEAFGKKGQPTWCYANFDPENKDVYGKLYNFYAVIDPRGLAPKGWHIPTIAEFHQLIDYAGGVEVANTHLKSRYYWSDNHKGTNSTGFNGMPGGYIWPDGDFSDIGSRCAVWSNSQDTYDGVSKALYMSLSTSKTKMSKTFISDYGGGRSVRLIKD